METTANTKSTIILFDRANFQLQNTVFHHSHHHYLCICTRSEQPACYARKNLHGHLECGFSFMPLLALLKYTNHLLTCADIHCLLSINIQKHLWMPFFSPGRNSVAHLCFTCSSMSPGTVGTAPSCQSSGTLLGYRGWVWVLLSEAEGWIPWSLCIPSTSRYSLILWYVYINFAVILFKNKAKQNKKETTVIRMRTKLVVEIVNYVFIWINYLYLGTERVYTLSYDFPQSLLLYFFHTELS